MVQILTDVIAIEGPDGSGKTTQATLLTERLNQRGHNAVCVRPVYALLDALPVVGEPAVSPRRRRHDDRRGGDRLSVLAPIGVAYAILSTIYMAVVHRDVILVCDRYFYQFFFDLLGDAGLPLVRIFPRPAVTVLLIGDGDLLRERIDDFDRAAGAEYQSAVLDFYEQIADESGVIAMDAAGGRRTINDAILEIVTDDVIDSS